MQMINDIQSIYLQTVPTLTFQKHRGGNKEASTVCRLCRGGNESVMHLLSNCEFFLKIAFKRRHDRVLQYIIFNLLVKYNILESCPAWYSKVVIKPRYSNEDIDVYWDIPEYSGHENEDEDRTQRPDGKIVLKKEKQIYVLEMSVPWIDNRQSKFQEKEEKYRGIIQTLKVDNPTFNVKQLTFIIDCLGGYSANLVENLKLLGFTKNSIDSMLFAVQKIVVSEAARTINHFKVMTIT